MFSIAATSTPDSHLGIRRSATLGIGWSHTRGIGDNNSPSNNELKCTTQMGSPLLNRAEPLASCERAPKEKKLLPDSVS